MIFVYVARASVDTTRKAVSYQRSDTLPANLQDIFVVARVKLGSSFWLLESRLI